MSGMSRREVRVAAARIVLEREAHRVAAGDGVFDLATFLGECNAVEQFLLGVPPA